MISAVDIIRVCGQSPTEFNERPSSDRGGHEALRSPGLLSRHYAPHGRLVVWNWTDEIELDRRLAAEGVPPDKVVVIAYDQIPMHGRWPNIHLVPNDPDAYARAIYSQLHACDACGMQLIVIESPPPSPEWDGIRDRLARASTLEPSQR
jgi:L-threonylcarbamoyladenylate synthase